MSDTLDDLEGEAIRIPSNIMGLLRQSYDSREKALDWVLAFAVAGTLVYVFRDDLRGLIYGPPGDPDAGRADSQQPSQDVGGAFPQAGRRPDLYTYNMPSSRVLRQGRTVSATPPPTDPSSVPFNVYDN